MMSFISLLMLPHILKPVLRHLKPLIVLMRSSKHHLLEKGFGETTKAQTKRAVTYLVSFAVDCRWPCPVGTNGLIVSYEAINII